jgi:hypothetical protein
MLTDFVKQDESKKLYVLSYKNQRVESCLTEGHINQLIITISILIRQQLQIPQVHYINGFV